MNPGLSNGCRTWLKAYMPSSAQVSSCAHIPRLAQQHKAGPETLTDHGKVAWDLNLVSFQAY